MSLSPHFGLFADLSLVLSVLFAPNYLNRDLGVRRDHLDKSNFKDTKRALRRILSGHSKKRRYFVVMIDFEAVQLNSLHVLLATFTHKSRLCPKCFNLKEAFHSPSPF